MGSDGRERQLPSIHAPGGLDPAYYEHKSTTKRKSIVPMNPIDGDADMMDIQNESTSGTIADYIANERGYYSSTSSSSHYKTTSTHNKNSKFSYDQKQDDFFANFVESIDKENTPIINTTEVYLIIDTNFIISHLNLLDELRRMSKENNDIFRLIIPTMVIDELDGLKQSNRVSNLGESISKKARIAINWYYTLLHDLDSVVKIQKLSQRIDRSTTKDDAILDCSIYFKTKFPDSLVILMTDDKNLCTKAFAEGLLTISFKEYMSAKIVFYTIIRENNSKLGQLQQQQSQPISNTNDYTTNNSTINEQYYNDEMVDVDDMSYEFAYPEDITKQEEEEEKAEVPDSSPPLQTQPTETAPVTQRLGFDEAKYQIYKIIEKLALEATEHILKEEFKEDLELLQYDLDDLQDCCKIILRFKVSTFSSYLRKVSGLNPITLLTNGNTSSSSVRNFKLCQCDLINGRDDLNAFVEFWKNVIDAFYSEREKILKDSLYEVYKIIDDIIDHIDYRI